MTEIAKSTKENNDTTVEKPSIYSLELTSVKGMGSRKWR